MEVARGYLLPVGSSPRSEDTLRKDLDQDYWLNLPSSQDPTVFEVIPEATQEVTLEDLLPGIMNPRTITESSTPFIGPLPSHYPFGGHLPPD